MRCCLIGLAAALYRFAAFQPEKPLLSRIDCSSDTIAAWKASAAA
jgi:hypothetical protein